MKTKFIIYCIMLATIFACQCFISSNSNDIENQEEYNDGYKAYSEGFQFSVPYIMTDNNTSESNDSVYNKKSGTMLPLHSDSFIVKVQSKTHTLYFLFVFLITIIQLYAIITFIKFFISVYKGNVFDSKTENRARILGIAQILISLIDYIYSALIVKEANNTIDIEGYEINSDVFGISVSSNPTLYIGFILLILSEVFRMARKLKEEQEFTI
ncbi:MAG: DUF2975 domain-containing protein [Bacteroidaceae bacterium]|nr:DUF2975 domain-containing protein [Bacteroidaceae bacterium]